MFNPLKSLFCVSILMFAHFSAMADSLPLETIKLPKGFKISIYAENIPNARAMTLGDKGTLFVGSRSAGNVYAVMGTGKDQKVLIIDENLNLPVGVAFKDGDLYVSEVNRILRYDNIESSLSNPPKPVIVNDSFPRETHHGWKFIGFGPDNLLYVPVGAPCNICERSDPRYASIMRMKPDGSNLEIFAKGVRNTVGFDWHPSTEELWFTNNGRDWMGDNQPPDELNRASKKGEHFGYPYCHGGTISDPKYGYKKPCSDFTPPMANLGPHVAALGMRFYNNTQFPKEYQGKIFIAEHGSWNRSTPIGYRVTMVDPENNPQNSYQVFAEGWLQGLKTWGRPADVLVMPNGSLLVSDDYANVIYEITYSAKQAR